MLRILPVLIPLLFSSSSRADEMFSTLQGQWKTFFYRSGPTLVDIELTGSDRLFVEKAQFHIFMPLFQKDGVNFKITSHYDSESKDAEGIVTIKFKVIKAEIVHKSLREAEKANKIKYCNHSNWTPGVYNDVTGRTCIDDPEDPEAEPSVIPNAGEFFERRFHKKGNVIYTDHGVNDFINDPESMPIDYENPLYFLGSE